VPSDEFERLKQLIEEACVLEDDAVVSLEAAIDARINRLIAYDALFEATGSPAKPNRDVIVLSGRRHRSMDIIQRALRVSALNRLGL
jgi:hypothetical protein